VLVDLLLADRIDRHQLLGAGQVGTGEFGLGLERGDLRLGPGHLGLEGAGVDGEQGLALLHDLAFLEAHRLDGTGHAGAHLDRVGRLQAGGEFVELLHLALRRGRHRHGRRATGAAMAASAVRLLATGGQQGQQDRGQREREVLFHHARLQASARL